MSIYEGITHLLHPHPLETRPGTTSSSASPSSSRASPGSRLAAAPRRETAREGSGRRCRTSKDPSISPSSSRTRRRWPAWSSRSSASSWATAGPPCARRHRLDPHRRAPRRRSPCSWSTRARDCCSARAPTREVVEDIRALARGHPRRRPASAPRSPCTSGPRRCCSTWRSTSARSRRRADHRAIIRLEQEIREPHPEVSRIFIEARALQGGQRPGESLYADRERKAGPRNDREVR